MVKIINKKIEKFEADLKYYNELLSDGDLVLAITLNKIDIIENILAELYDVLNEAIISGQMQAIEELKDFARNNCREWNVEEMENIFNRL